ncbi:MAG: hypothetical protein ABIS50_12395 [Luteolibacter sp.]|uniref:hypothetical protein n=1 Tax=Luteolibacter sp. TaxID=1962973 RepID=UPI0032636DC6
MSHSQPLRRFWKFTALVVMFQLFVVQAMASSGTLHKHFHDHCDDPGHECAVTMMLHGGYDDVVPDIVPVDFISEAPDVPVLAPIAGDAQPSHLVGGVLAHAPPRGP